MRARARGGILIEPEELTKNADAHVRTELKKNQTVTCMRTRSANDDVVRLIRAATASPASLAAAAAAADPHVDR